MKIYLDANFFIPFVEGSSLNLHRFFMSAVSDGVEFVTSELTLLETLAGAEKTGNPRLPMLYEAILSPNDDLLDVHPIDRSILRRAARGRTAPGNKTPDAIHVATAIETGCEVFVSSDHKLRVPDGMRKVTLEELDGTK